ncbi:hypothetical protein [Dokdonia sp.]|uniref:hypothetical protein n=1 Tax=Dokdonia sp. TaxID=2024995 RepID=UPI003266920E
MKTINRFTSKFFAIILLTSFLLTSCNSDDDTSQDFSSTFTFDIFTVQPDEQTVIMNGEIKSRTLQDFTNMLQGHPNIQRINMGTVPGSNDDEINFQVGIMLRQNNINTHILDNGIIASGGVDLFLAGVQRTRGENTMIGVHSWSDGDGNQATDFPVDSAEHLPNIQYYENIGYNSQWSRAFYFFTINAAPAEGIHWMTEEEITQFEVISQ